VVVNCANAFLSKLKDKEKKDPVEVARVDDGEVVSIIGKVENVGEVDTGDVANSEDVSAVCADAVDIIKKVVRKDTTVVIGEVDIGARVDIADKVGKVADGKGTLIETETLTERKSTGKLATSSKVEKSSSVTDVGVKFQQPQGKVKVKKLL
jgi:hypothetical protein